jgi:hypothetical protein
VDGEEVYLFPQWWVLSILTDARRTKEWLREIRRAVKEAGIRSREPAEGASA